MSVTHLIAARGIYGADLFVLLAILFVLTCSSASAAEKQAGLRLASGGTSDYTIVIGTDATDADKYAAAELAKHLKLVTGAVFPIKSEADAGKGPFVLLGPSKLLASVTGGVKPQDLAAFGEEELLVRTSGKHLILVGGRPRGTLYAVYSFLEDDLGCRWWTSTATTIPHKPTLEISPVDRRDKPFMEYRLPAFSNYMVDAIYSVRNRISAMQDNPSENAYWPGGRFMWANRYCHSFASLVPAEKLMAEHPAWFSRGTDPEQFQYTGQLCLTNPEVEDYVVDQLKAIFRANAASSIASVSQNDNQQYCSCERCSDLAETQGQSGLMVGFLNRIAARLKPEFPDKILHTFAYQYTQEPPLDKSIRVDDNVVIQLTTEGVSHAVPLSETKLKDVLERWSSIAKRIYIWDYETNFLYHQAPIPNLISLGPNFNWFAENNVRGMLIQGGGRVAGEFSDLRGWVAAKLMWNPRRNGEELIDEFLKGYYGEAAAPHLRQYIELLQERTGHEVWDMYVYILKMASLDWRLFLDSQRIFDKAEAAAKDEPEFLQRVRTARMQVDYMLILRHEEYLRASEEAGQPWPAEYAVHTRTRAFFDNGSAIGMPELCEPWDNIGALALGEHAGQWKHFREKCSMLMTDDIAQARIGILAMAAAKACELMKLDQAASYISYLQACVSSGNTNVREAPIELICPRMQDHVVGDFEDWETVSEAGTLGLYTVDQSDCSGTFKIGWDNEYVYVFAAVQDDVYVPDHERQWTGDGIELYFNMLDDDNLPHLEPAFSYGPDDFHFGISADGIVYDYDSASIGNPLGLGMVPGMITEHKRTPTGYLLEVSIPWKSMFLGEASSGYTFGFNIAVDDLDVPGEGLKRQILWRGSKAYINTKDWARVRLQD